MSMLVMVVASTGYSARLLTLQDMLNEHPAELSYVFECGQWVHEDQRGHFRVSGADFLFGGSRLWVDWLGERDSDGFLKAV